jgi:hypothetical protein
MLREAAPVQRRNVEQRDAAFDGAAERVAGDAIVQPGKEVAERGGPEPDGGHLEAGASERTRRRRHALRHPGRVERSTGAH